MKYTTIAAAAAALLPLAGAAEDFDTRKGGHLKWRINNLTASVGDAYGKPFAMYDMMVYSSDNPDFGTGAENSCYATSDHELTGCEEPQNSGAYSMSTSVNNDNNTLIITLKSRRAMAQFLVPISKMDKWDASEWGGAEDGPNMTWTLPADHSELVSETKDLEVNQADPAWLVPTGVQWDLASATASGIATAMGSAPIKTGTASVSASPAGASPTSEPSATSSPSAKPSDEHSAATRQSAFAGLVFAVGLWALVF
ncbi:hypothetical protein PG984_009982 [Apiospora sp. TS-2023a]